MEYYITTYFSIVGELILACTKEALIGLWIKGQKYECYGLPQSVIEDDNQPIFIQTKAWLDAYFNHETTDDIVLPLQPNGTAFQKKIWQLLLEIPYGQVVTYGELAEKFARNNQISKMSARAVGTAIGKNPISIIIPCHRVVGRNGSLTGYAGGIENKKILLQHEEVMKFETIR